MATVRRSIHSPCSSPLPLLTPKPPCPCRPHQITSSSVLQGKLQPSQWELSYFLLFGAWNIWIITQLYFSSCFRRNIPPPCQGLRFPLSLSILPYHKSSLSWLRYPFKSSPHLHAAFFERPGYVSWTHFLSMRTDVSHNLHTEFCVQGSLWKPLK